MTSAQNLKGDLSGRKIAVIGAGMGGLAAALRLAHRGCDVTVFEKNSFVGGRCHEVRVGPCLFDGGPTLLMMLEPFRRLFRDVGERFDDHLTVQKCDPNSTVFFGDGSHIANSTDRAYMDEQIRAMSGEADAAAFTRMMADLERLYGAAIPMFVRRNWNSPLDLASPVLGWSALRHGMLGNLERMMRRRFRDHRLRTLFCLQSMYLGLSPRCAPSVYAVLAFMEYGEGIWHPIGGLNAIPRKVAELAMANGAKIRLESPVKHFDGHQVTLESGEASAFDAVICGVDLPFAQEHMVGSGETLTAGRTPHRSRKLRYSCSALMAYIAYEGSLPRLGHHSIILSRDFEGNLDQIFERMVVPDDPSIYTAISERADPAMSAPGFENLFLLIPVPNLDHDWTAEDESTVLSRAFARLEEQFGFDRSKIKAMKTRGPREWREEFSLDKGAAFGLSHDFFQSICFRPSNKSTACPGLYFVGASTHPGNGLPMTLISAELVEERLLAELGRSVEVGAGQ